MAEKQYVPFQREIRVTQGGALGSVKVNLSPTANLVLAVKPGKTDNPEDAVARDAHLFFSPPYSNEITLPIFAAKAINEIPGFNARPVSIEKSPPVYDGELEVSGGTYENYAIIEYSSDVNFREFAKYILDHLEKSLSTIEKLTSDRLMQDHGHRDLEQDFTATVVDPEKALGRSQTGEQRFIRSLDGSDLGMLRTRADTIIDAEEQMRQSIGEDPLVEGTARYYSDTKTDTVVGIEVYDAFVKILALTFAGDDYLKIRAALSKTLQQDEGYKVETARREVDERTLFVSYGTDPVFDEKRTLAELFNTVEDAVLENTKAKGLGTAILSGLIAGVVAIVGMVGMTFLTPNVPKTSTNPPPGKRTTGDEKETPEKVKKVFPKKKDPKVLKAMAEAAERKQSMDKDVTVYMEGNGIVYIPKGYSKTVYVVDTGEGDRTLKSGGARPILRGDGDRLVFDATDQKAKITEKDGNTHVEIPYSDGTVTKFVMVGNARFETVVSVHQAADGANNGSTITPSRANFSLKGALDHSQKTNIKMKNEVAAGTRKVTRVSGDMEKAMKDGDITRLKIKGKAHKGSHKYAPERTAGVGRGF